MGQVDQPVVYQNFDEISRRILMLYFSPSKNCTKNVSARTLRLPTEALPRLLLSHITRAIRLTPFAQIWQSRTSYVRNTLYAMLAHYYMTIG